MSSNVFHYVPCPVTLNTIVCGPVPPVFNVNGISSLNHRFCLSNPVTGDVFVDACPYNVAAFNGALFVSDVKPASSMAGIVPAAPFKSADIRNVSVDGTKVEAVQLPEVFEIEIPKYS